MKNAYLFLLLIAATLCSCQITTKQASAKMPDLIGRWQTEAMDLGSQQVTEEFFFQDDKNMVMSMIIYHTGVPEKEPWTTMSLNGTYQLTDSICTIIPDHSSLTWTPEPIPGWELEDMNELRVVVIPNSESADIITLRLAEGPNPEKKVLYRQE